MARAQALGPLGGWGLLAAVSRPSRSLAAWGTNGQFPVLLGVKFPARTFRSFNPFTLNAHSLRIPAETARLQNRDLLSQPSSPSLFFQHRHPYRGLRGVIHRTARSESTHPAPSLHPRTRSAAMAERYIPEHRRTQFKAKNTFKPEELRRRREEQQVEIRKAKREENLAKRRGIAGRDA